MVTQAQAYPIGDATPSAQDAVRAHGEDSYMLKGSVLRALRARGESVRAWAARHAWGNTSVQVVIERWIEDPKRRGKMPLGGVSRAIALALQNDLGSDVVPLADGNRPPMRKVA